ncbi:MAG: hypothetical protein ACJAVO_001098, partial [Parvibaculaceae bacterium]
MKGASVAGKSSKRRISQSSLWQSLDDHKRFVQREAGGKRLILSYQKAENLDFAQSDLSEAELVGMEAVGAHFFGAKMVQANLFGANLQRANLVGADLSRADLRGCSLYRADLREVDLTDADLRDGSIMEQSDDGELSYIDRGDPSARLDEANLSSANLANARLGRLVGHGADLSQANLEGARLKGCDLSGANLSGAVLTGADLSNANLTNCDLRGASLTGSVLDGCNLDGANLTSAQFSRGALDDVASMEGVSLPAGRETLGQTISEIVELHRKWIVTAGREGKQAKFEGIDLTGLDAAEVELSAANLTGCLLAESR